MLVEEFMMAHRRGVRRDIAITNRYMTGLPSDQLIVAWGQRGRIGDPALRARVQFVLGQILPWIDPVAVDSLPPPIAMPAGVSWYATVQLPPSPLPGRQAAARARRRGGAAAGAGAGPPRPAPAGRALSRLYLARRDFGAGFSRAALARLAGATSR